jgi:hypothetical protein
LNEQNLWNPVSYDEHRELALTNARHANVSARAQTYALLTIAECLAALVDVVYADMLQKEKEEDG